MFDSVTTTALSSALDGLAARQRAIAENIANVNTPGYRAKVVSFENALSQSVASGNGSAVPVESQSTNPVNTNGNNVSIDNETLNNVSTVLRYQFASQAVGAEFNAVRSAMKTA